jgi:hypothetical protein
MGNFEEKSSAAFASPAEAHKILCGVTINESFPPNPCSSILLG